MKKQIFSRGLFWEGLRRPRLPGILFLIIALLCTCLPAVFYAANHTAADVISAPLLASWLLPVLFAAPFALTHTLFSFLNSRSGSDFYHALPQTRVSLFLSFSAAASLWLAAIAVLPILAASLIYSLAGGSFVPSTVPWSVFTMLIGILLVEACALLAMSVTGTAFSNLVLYGLLLFLPRFVCTVYNLCLYSNSQIVSIRHTPGLLNPNWNIPVKLFLGLAGNTFGVDTGNRLYMSLPAVLYTLALALIYGALACLCFHLRRSEAAGSSAPSRLLQHIYRCAIALPAAIAVPAVLVNAQADSSLSWNVVGPWLTTLIVVTLLIYYLFELITTKKVKNLLTATPWLLVLVVLDLAFGISLGHARGGLLRFQPAAEEVAGVTLSPFSSTGYNTLLTGRVDIRSETVRADTVELLKENIAGIKSGVMVNPYRYDVVFHMKNGGDVYRTLYLPKDETASVYQDLRNDREYADARVSLPEDGSILQMSCEGLGSADVKKLWNLFQSEYDGLSYANKINSINSLSYGDNPPDSVATLSVQGSLGVDSFRSDYYISALTPRSEALYVQLVNAANGAKLKALLQGDLAETTIAVSFVNRPSKAEHQFYSFAPGVNELSAGKALASLLVDHIGKDVDLNGTVVSVETYKRIGNVSSIRYYATLSSAELKSLEALKLNK